MFSSVRVNLFCANSIYSVSILLPLCAALFIDSLSFLIKRDTCENDFKVTSMGGGGLMQSHWNDHEQGYILCKLYLLMKRDTYEYDLKVTSCNLLVIQIQIKILVKMTSMGGGGMVGGPWNEHEQGYILCKLYLLMKTDTCENDFEVTSMRGWGTWCDAPIWAWALSRGIYNANCTYDW